MPDRGSPIKPQLCIYIMGEVLVTGSLFLCVGFLPHSVHWRAFAPLKQHGYIVKHAAFPGFSSSGLKIRISKACFPLNATALADYYFNCFHFLVTIKSWLWVSRWLWASSFAQLFMEVKGMWWKWKKEVYCSDETGWKLHNRLDYIPAQSLHFVLANSSNMLRGWWGYFCYWVHKLDSAEVLSKCRWN